MTKLHVAIIPDGNRRWAKAKTWLPWKGHEAAGETLDARLATLGRLRDLVRAL